MPYRMEGIGHFLQGKTATVAATSGALIAGKFS